MQIRSFRGSGEPVWVIALLQSARFRLGPDPRRALGPAATPAASTGRTRDRTRPMLHERQNVLVKAPSTRDPKRTWLGHASLFPNTTCVASLSLRQLASHVACLIQEQLRHRAYYPAFERYDPDRKRRSLQFDRHFP